MISDKISQKKIKTVTFLWDTVWIAVTLNLVTNIVRLITIFINCQLPEVETNLYYNNAY